MEKKHLKFPSEKITMDKFFKKTGIVWALVLLCIVMSFASPAFLTYANITSILKQSAINGILAVGMTLVMISGGIDLSIGSVVAFCCVSAAYFSKMDTFLAVPFIVSALIGALIGLVNGLGISYIGFPPFIMTLSTMTAVRGLILLITDSKSVFSLPKKFLAIANNYWLGVPILVWFFIAIVILGHILLKATVFGKWIYAVGGNERAANLSGINTPKVKTLLYVICGLLAGITGALLASRISSGNPSVADGYEMDAVAAAVIGGVSMSGGSGTMFGTLIGTLVLGVMRNSFDIMGLSSYYQQIMKGVIILISVFIDICAKKKKIKKI